jgi:DNA-binding GntR family transcriptional regulator
MHVIKHVKTKNLPAGAHLTERGLGEILKVSRTPARAALKFLADTGFVGKSAKRGYFLLKSADQIVMPEQTSQEDRSYLQIAEDRLDGQLPARVTESELMRRYSISRSKLIPILTRIMHEGWIDRLPGKGWEFQSLLDSVEIYEQGHRFRMVIEPAALLEPGFHLEPNVCTDLRVKQQAMLNGGILQFSRMELFEIGSSFHETILAGAKNPFYSDAIRRINRLRRLLEYRSKLDRVRLVHECREHLALLDLIEAGDRKAAAKFLHHHLAAALPQKLNAVTANPRTP